MIPEFVLLVAYFAFTCALAYLAYFAVRCNRPALTVFAGFCLFYLSFRGLMLASGNYGVFGILHGGRAFDPAILPKVLAVSVLWVIAVRIGYGRFWAREFDLSALDVMPDFTSSLAFFLVWFAAVAALILADVMPNLNWIFSFVVLGGVYLILYKPRYYPRLLTYSFGALAIVFALAQTVERRDWAIAVASLSLVAIISQSRKTLRLALLASVMVLVISFAAIMLRTGEGLSVGDTVDRVSSDALLPIVEMELDFPLIYDDLAILLDEVPRNVDFTNGRFFFKPLFSWVPREIWPEKPDSISRYYTQTFNPRFYILGGSEPVTFVGELYWNFSYLGLVFAFALGLLIRRIDEYWLGGRNLLSKINGLVLATMLFYLLRGPIDTFWLAFALYFGAWFAFATARTLLESAALLSTRDESQVRREWR